MSPSAEKGGIIAVYDFITQYAIYFMGKKPNPIQFLACVFVPKLRGKCMFGHRFCYIVIYL